MGTSHTGGAVSSYGVKKGGKRYSKKNKPKSTCSKPFTRKKTSSSIQTQTKTRKASKRRESFKRNKK